MGAAKGNDITLRMLPILLIYLCLTPIVWQCQAQDGKIHTIFQLQKWQIHSSFVASAFQMIDSSPEINRGITDSTFEMKSLDVSERFHCES